MIVDGTLLFYFLLSAMNLSIALYVLFREHHRLTNRVFAFFGTMVSLWTLAVGTAYNPATTTIISVRLAFATASLMLVGFLTLILVFPAAHRLPRTPLYSLFAGAGVLSSGLAFTPLLVADVRYDSVGLSLTYGRLHPSFALYVYLVLGYCFFGVFGKLRTATGFARLQLRYLLLGLLLPGVAITVTNLLVPIITQASNLGRYGPAFTLAFLALTAHAIIRHRLMDIRLVISRSVTSVLAVLFSAAAFLGLIGLASLFFGDRRYTLPLWMELALIFPIALLFPSVRLLFMLSLDRYLYRKPYDYEQTVREASRTINTILDLPSLLDYVCKVIRETVRPEHISVYMSFADGSEYRRVATQHSIDSSDRKALTTLSPQSPLGHFFSRSPAPILREELARLPQNPNTRSLLNEFSRLQAEYVHPILDDQRVVGLVVLGPKLSGDPYFSEDLDLLTTLVAQAAIAIRNAQLYRQVVLVNEYVENILATMENGVIAVRADGAVTLFNPAAERLTGRSSDVVKGGPLNALPTTIATPLQATLSDRRPRLDVETMIQSDNTDLTPVICSTAILTDRAGDTLGAIAVLSDLTKFKQLEAEKRKVEHLASIGAIASTFAHEIKNPLVAIKTFAELLPERFNDDDFRNDFSKVVIREIDRIDELVARLRSLGVPGPQQVARIDLRDPIEETLSLLRGHLELMRIEAKVLCDTDLPTIVGDRAQLKQLFLNLFMNSIEAMESGGDITVTLDTRDSLGHCVVVAEIRDSGHGIPDSLLPKMWDPFVTTKVQGSGLGLSICRGIVDAHQASIRAANNKGTSGATITLEFPAHSELSTLTSRS